MELSDVVRSRRMCRDFSTEPLPEGTIERLVDLARYAPSAGHTQGWAFLALEGPDQTRAFWEQDADADWLASPSLPGLLRAPAVVVAWTNPQMYLERYARPDKGGRAPGGQPSWNLPWWTVDCAFACMIMLLGATDLGLGALFFALRPGAEERLRDRFGVPEPWLALGALAVGWPTKRPNGPPSRPAAASPEASGTLGRPARPRRRLAEVLHCGHW